ncbi:ribosomal RNA processing protein 36 homolog [Clytia hemisphaerica]|uniref:ribosomal RNA processing protein 36 homolog n=1 Tax=Clytia hemisphaerica TaxID=252671 RepID=UPI0034D3FEAB
MKRSTRDPRFNDLSGAYNEELFQKSYAFVDDIKKNEYESVKKQLRKVKNTEEKEKLLKLKQKMDTESKVKAELAKRREMSKQRKKEMAEQTEGGKKPFYLKNSDKKKIELAEKYKELKASGKLDKYMSKKRKRNTQKDKKKFTKIQIVMIYELF